MPVVTGFIFDDRALDKMAAHGISERRAFQVLEERHIIVPNRKGQAAPYLVIGRDRGGAYITLPVFPTWDEELWRPVTAWPSKDREKALFRKMWSNDDEP